MPKFDLDNSLSQYTDALQEALGEILTDVNDNFADEQSDDTMSPFENWLEHTDHPEVEATLLGLQSALEEAVENFKSRLKADIEAWVKKNPELASDGEAEEDDSE